MYQYETNALGYQVYLRLASHVYDTKVGFFLWFFWISQRRAFLPCQVPGASGYDGTGTYSSIMCVKSCAAVDMAEPGLIRP